MTDLDKWLLEAEEALKSAGYRKYQGHYKSEDFGYWKTVSQGETRLYQVAALFYDYRKFGRTDCQRIGVQYECLLIGDSGINLSVNIEQLTTEAFEKICEEFYRTMSVYL